MPFMSPVTLGLGEAEKPPEPWEGNACKTLPEPRLTMRSEMTHGLTAKKRREIHLMRRRPSGVGTHHALGGFDCSTIPSARLRCRKDSLLSFNCFDRSWSPQGLMGKKARFRHLKRGESNTV